MRRERLQVQLSRANSTLGLRRRTLKLWAEIGERKRILLPSLVVGQAPRSPRGGLYEVVVERGRPPRSSDLDVTVPASYRAGYNNDVMVVKCIPVSSVPSHCHCT